MPTPRIAPASPPYLPEVAAQFTAFTKGREPIKLFRTMARNPRVLARFFGGSLLDPGSIGEPERELIILRTTARCGSEYEWGVHVKVFAARNGLTPDQVAATVTAAPADPIWSPEQARILRLVDDLHDSASVPAGLWSALAAAWQPEQLLEMISLVGKYHMVSFITNAVQVELEDFAPRFPATASRAAG